MQQDILDQNLDHLGMLLFKDFGKERRDLLHARQIRQNPLRGEIELAGDVLLIVLHAIYLFREDTSRISSQASESPSANRMLLD